MISRTPFYIFILFLIIIGISLTWLRHNLYGVPLLPNTDSDLWDIEAKVELIADGGPTKVILNIPQQQKNYTIIDESTSSPGFGSSFSVDKENNNKTVEWNTREASKKQVLYYKVQILADPYAIHPSQPKPQDNFPEVNFEGVEKNAAQELIDSAQKFSSDPTSLARELIKLLNEKSNQSASLLLKNHSKPKLLTDLLSLSNVHAHIIGVLALEDGRRNQSVVPMLEVWNNSSWQLLDIQTGDLGKPNNYLIWNNANQSLLDVIGGHSSNVSFSMISRDISASNATQLKVKSDNLLNFSIHSLPIEEQTMFKTILLVPIGALLVVFLRLIIGIKTSGTFMPVLIALAFVQTTLLVGVIGFLLLVGTGLIIRSYLSKLNLLLVARISSVIIIVIMIMALFTIVAYKVGLVEGLSISYFPMIILSWTIERMSILWEEEGSKEVLIQGGGSLFTAILVYLAMTNEYVRYLTFNFIGSQFIILAIILILGNYTGYRLSELKRFNHLIKGD
ncbi:gonadoliberin III [Paraphotobacterium marinum]|uniref:Gonadoliberin III n=1 Tax=Paraphotobacterium marinum TaxID=1755811 RepID=A0A220VF62_9GAMM|nr:inactive transglutaminase family protein [Paraphotobacterium marinum]ASK78573.1 gonadoliberin III [Paraphotobacterium marinum]